MSKGKLTSSKTDTKMLHGTFAISSAVFVLFYEMRERV